MSTTRTSPGTEIVATADHAVYMAPSGEIQLDVRIDSETVWLTQAQIAELFSVSRQNINLHMGNVYREGELDRGSTCKDFLQVRQEGRRTVQRKIEHYSLDAIISVGPRSERRLDTCSTAREKSRTNKGFEHLRQGSANRWTDP